MQVSDGYYTMNTTADMFFQTHSIGVTTAKQARHNWDQVLPH